MLVRVRLSVIFVIVCLIGLLSVPISAEPPSFITNTGQIIPLPDYSGLGEYDAGRENVTVNPSTGVTARLYYPATSNGLGASFDPSGGPYPVIAFGHGFQQEVYRYEGMLEHMTSYGYFVIAVNSHTGLFPNHNAFANDMNDALDYVVEQNFAGGSPYNGHVAIDAQGLMGHSMGGGANILAAADNPNVGAIFTMAAAETSPSAINDMPDIDAPIVLLAGTDDGIVPVGQHGQLMYNNGVAPVLLPVIDGAFHCGFQNAPYPLFCDTGSITRPEQLAETFNWGVSFFDAYLKADLAGWQRIYGFHMLQDDNIDTQWDAGVTVDSFVQNGGATPGSSVTYDITITNTSSSATTYVGMYESELGWPISFSTVSGTLGPGQSATVTATVDIPAGATAGDKEIGYLKILDSSDGATGAFTAMRTTAQ